LDSDKATTLNSFFSNVFCVEDAYNVPAFNINFAGSFLSNVQAKIEDVNEKLLGLNPNKFIGSDNIHPRVLKEAADYFCSAIDKFF